MSLFLILGPETALSDRALAKIMASLREEKAEVTTIFGPDAILGDIADALAPSLFSDKRALVIRDLQDLPSESHGEVTTYLGDVDPTMTVIFVHKGGVKGKALLDQIKKAKAEVINCDTLKKESEKQEFVRHIFLDLGRKATAGAIAALVGALGNDLRELSAACSQIASDTTGVINEEVIDKYHHGRIETTGFDVASAALDGDVASALLSLRSAIATGTDPVMVTSAMAAALRGLAKVSGTNPGSKSFELAGPLGMAPWQIDKARRQLSSWTPAGISRAVQAVALADAQVKGAAVDPIYALEQALSAIGVARTTRS
ncbi:MAG: DNA polymerase III subunit delta [Actinobacteria bacterium]|nr:DNA polymerase III subunit delta [Actinomycetota bacterium]